MVHKSDSGQSVYIIQITFVQYTTCFRRRKKLPNFGFIIINKNYYVFIFLCFIIILNIYFIFVLVSNLFLWFVQSFLKQCLL